MSKNTLKEALKPKAKAKASKGKPAIKATHIQKDLSTVKLDTSVIDKHLRKPKSIAGTAADSYPKKLPTPEDRKNARLKIQPVIEMEVGEDTKVGDPIAEFKAIFPDRQTPTRLKDDWTEEDRKEFMKNTRLNYEGLQERLLEIGKPKITSPEDYLAATIKTLQSLVNGAVANGSYHEAKIILNSLIGLTETTIAQV